MNLMRRTKRFFWGFCVSCAITVSVFLFPLIDFDSKNKKGANLELSNKCESQFEYLNFSTRCPIKTDNCVLEYKGIQYATSQRFEKPILTNFSLETCGVKYGNMNRCYQGGEDEYENECLYLDIYTKSKFKKAPIMVYSHGGGHISGFNGWAFGDDIITKTEDVIYVNFQYRLGVFGGSGTEDLLRSEDYIISPLIYDHRVVLEWIQQYIHLFGGDSNKVTLAGFSAGAINTAMMVSSSTICPLFHRAILYGFWNTRPRALRTISLLEQEEIMKKRFGVENVTEYILNASPYDIWSVTTDLGDNRPLPDKTLVLHNHLSYSNPCNLPIIIDGSVVEVELWESLFGISSQADTISKEIIDDWNMTYGKEVLNSIFIDYFSSNLKKRTHEENLLFANDMTSVSNVYGALGIKNVTKTSPVYSIMHSWSGKRGKHGHGAGVALLNNRAIFNIDNISHLSPLVTSYREKINEFMEYGIVKEWYSVGGDNDNPKIMEVSNSGIHITNLRNLSYSMYSILRKIKDFEN